MQKKSRMCRHPFQDYMSTGPRYNKQTGRHSITLVPLDKSGPLSRRGMAYARYLMCVQAGEELGEGMETDHIDGDRTHDLLPNLRVVTKAENSAKAHSDPLSVLRRSENIFEMECPHCGNTFRRPRGKTHIGSRSGKKMTFCGTSCSKYSGRYRGFVQDHRWVPPEKYEPKLLHEPWEDWSTTLPTRYLIVVRERKTKAKTCTYCRKPFFGKRKKDRRDWYCSDKCSQRARGREVPGRDKMERFVADIAEGKTSWKAVGGLYGKSDNAARKWAKKYGLI